MSFSRRVLFSYAAGAALIASCLPGAALAATTKSTAYFMAGDGSSNVYLIDWKPNNRARVASPLGAQAGGVANDGTQKVITLDSPLSTSFVNYDDCGEEIQQRQDVNQVVVRDLTGGVFR